MNPLWLKQRQKADVEINLQNKEEVQGGDQSVA